MNRLKDMYKAADRGTYIIKSCIWPRQLDAAKKYVDNFKNLFDINENCSILNMTIDEITALELLSKLNNQLKEQPSYMQVIYSIKIPSKWEKF